MVYHFDPMARSGGEMPDTIFPARIRVRVVGATDDVTWSRNLVLATTLFAVMFVLVQCKPVVARALVRSGSVFAFVLASTVVDSAFVHVCGQNAQLAWFNTI